jgi:hypothetical protein
MPRRVPWWLQREPDAGPCRAAEEQKGSKHRDSSPRPCSSPHRRRRGCRRQGPEATCRIDPVTLCRIRDAGCEAPGAEDMLGGKRVPLFLELTLKRQRAVPQSPCMRMHSRLSLQHPGPRIVIEAQD